MTTAWVQRLLNLPMRPSLARVSRAASSGRSLETSCQQQPFGLHLQSGRRALGLLAH